MDIAALTLQLVRALYVVWAEHLHELQGEDCKTAPPPSPWYLGNGAM